MKKAKTVERKQKHSIERPTHHQKMIDQYVRTKYRHEMPEWCDKENRLFTDISELQQPTHNTLDAQVLGIKDVCEPVSHDPSSLRYEVLMRLPNKDDFIAFLQGLQHDQKYMRCITRFTIDYMKRKREASS